MWIYFALPGNHDYVCVKDLNVLKHLLHWQVMHCVPGVRAISEPYGPVHLHGLYVRKQIKIDQYRLLLKSYIRLLCKLERSNVSNMVISVL